MNPSRNPSFEVSHLCLPPSRASVPRRSTVAEDGPWPQEEAETPDLGVRALPKAPRRGWGAAAAKPFFSPRPSCTVRLSWLSQNVLVEQKSKHAGLFHRHHPHMTEKSTPPHRKIMVTGWWVTCQDVGVEPERRYTVFRGTVVFSRTPTTFQPTKVATSPCRLSFEVVPFRLFAVNRYYVTMVDTTNTAAVGSLCCLRSV